MKVNINFSSQSFYVRHIYFIIHISERTILSMLELQIADTYPVFEKKGLQKCLHDKINVSIADDVENKCKIWRSANR